jgi:hypothetical protein
MQIEEIQNNLFPVLEPVKEIMEIFIPGIEDDNIPRRNGSIWLLTGSGGSGKTSLLLNFFRNKKLYKNKFHNVFYICPEASFHSVDKHPFEKHDKVFHELTPDFLYVLYDTLVGYKTSVVDNIEKKKNKKHNKQIVFLDDDNDDKDEEKEDTELKYNCVIIDDMADALKDKTIEKALSKLLIKARHLNTMFIFTLQSYFYFPKILRKQITNLTLFKPKNYEEWDDISKELFNLNKDDALRLYNYVFDKRYNHLDVDTNTNMYYKNFNKLILSNN